MYWSAWIVYCLRMNKQPVKSKQSRFFFTVYAARVMLFSGCSWGKRCNSTWPNKLICKQHLLSLSHSHTYEYLQASQTNYSIPSRSRLAKSWANSARAECMQWSHSANIPISADWAIADLGTYCVSWPMLCYSRGPEGGEFYQLNLCVANEFTVINIRLNWHRCQTLGSLGILKFFDRQKGF